MQSTLIPGLLVGAPQGMCARTIRQCLVCARLARQSSGHGEVDDLDDGITAALQQYTGRLAAGELSSTQSS